MLKFARLTRLIQLICRNTRSLVLARGLHMVSIKDAGATIVGDFTCKGFDTYGPIKLIGGIAKGHPDNDDIAAAKRFILKVIS